MASDTRCEELVVVVLSIYSSPTRLGIQGLDYTGARDYKNGEWRIGDGIAAAAKPGHLSGRAGFGPGFRKPGTKM